MPRLVDRIPVGNNDADSNAHAWRSASMRASARTSAILNRLVNCPPLRPADIDKIRTALDSVPVLEVEEYRDVR